MDLANQMKNSNEIIPPHLNAQVYRADMTGTNSLLYLDYIRCHTDGTLLIGRSELTGRYWNGGANIFASVEQGQKHHNEVGRNINLISGTPDGCFIEHSNKVLLCEDSGRVSIWANDDIHFANWYELASMLEHDDAAMSVDCLKSGQEYVTAGADGNIKVWDVNETKCTRNYKIAHYRSIYGVAVRPQSHNTFATASLDRTILLWDENIGKPALDLVNNDCGIHCLEWLDEYILLYGDEAGVLQLVDTRNTRTRLLNNFPASVHKIAVQHKTSNFAVACDNKIVSVCKIDEDNKLTFVYSNHESHTNYVRGLAWDNKDNNVLHTSGWDGEIKTHKIE